MSRNETNEKTITYNQFILDHNSYYGVKGNKVRYKDESELQDIIYELYDTCKFDYDDTEEKIFLYY